MSPPHCAPEKPAQRRDPLSQAGPGATMPALVPDDDVPVTPSQAAEGVLREVKAGADSGESRGQLSHSYRHGRGIRDHTATFPVRRRRAQENRTMAMQLPQSFHGQADCKGGKQQPTPLPATSRFRPLDNDAGLPGSQS